MVFCESDKVQRSLRVFISIDRSEKKHVFRKKSSGESRKENWVIGQKSHIEKNENGSYIDENWYTKGTLSQEKSSTLLIIHKIT